MKTLILSALAAASLHAANAQNPLPLTGAILDFQVSGKSLENRGQEAALLLNSFLSSSENLSLVERQELTKVMGELELGSTGTIDPGSASKIGHLIGAMVLVTGRAFEVGERVFLASKIMSTENGRVFGETVSFDNIKGLEAAARQLAGKIDATVKKHAPELVAVVESDGDRLKRLSGLVPAGKKPSISLSVQEQHIGQAVIDPAVETELGLHLQKLGYEVIASGAGRAADVVVSGEAFSEFAARYGNLVACRARVELKVQRRGDNKLLFVGRNTAAAADIAQHVAGKYALEKCARQLLEEMLPKIASK